MPSQTVLISGASIAGPALAYWLNRYGFRVTVVEKAPGPRAGGQAVDFKGRIHRTVLERMGIWDEVQARRTGLHDTVYLDAAGRELAVIPGEFSGGDVEILRGDLAGLLHERTAAGCDYRFGDSVTSLTGTADGVRAQFEQGGAQTFGLVIGADGIHSRVRRLAFGPERDYVRHLGYYYCVAGAPGWGHDARHRERQTARAWNAPGRMAARGGSKGSHMYLFASPELDRAHGDAAAQRGLIVAKFGDMGGEVPSMLAELDGLGDFYLDAIARVRMDGRYTRGRVALVGDAGFGNTLGGFGTGLAVVGAYVLAGELAVAGGNHTVAYGRYDEIMRRYAKIAGTSNAGRFLAPKTAGGIRARNWFLGSRAFSLMGKYADNAASDIDLADYEALVKTPGKPRLRRLTASGRENGFPDIAPAGAARSGRATGIMRPRTRYHQEARENRTGRRLPHFVAASARPPTAPGPHETLGVVDCVDPRRSARRLGVRAPCPLPRAFAVPSVGLVGQAAVATVSWHSRGGVCGSTRPAPYGRSPYRPAGTKTRPPPRRRRLGALPGRP